MSNVTFIQTIQSKKVRKTMLNNYTRRNPQMVEILKMLAYGLLVYIIPTVLLDLVVYINAQGTSATSLNFLVGSWFILSGLGWWLIGQLVQLDLGRSGLRIYHRLVVSYLVIVGLLALVQVITS